ncbi:MAG: ComEC/Rec2 family competence protein [Planctomycetes bacterium]|nr:ComEC/Rec2 family competence protein [Planctomycetota bacterium]
MAALALSIGSWLGSEVPEVPATAWRGAVMAALALAGVALLAGSPAGARPAAAALLLLALGGLRARAVADSPAEPAGRFVPGRVLDGTVRGRLAPGRLEVEFAAGLVAPGETIALVGGRPAAARARGPEPAPRPRSDAPRVALLPDEIVRLAPPPDTLGARLAGALQSARAALLANLAAVDDPDGRALAAALVLGELALLAPEHPDLFVRTGTFHALAVSGVQVVLVAGVILAPLAALAGWLARPLGAERARIVREVVRALAVAAYVPLAGSGPPVARAALACVLAHLAPLVPVRERAPVGSPRGAGCARLPRRPDGVALWSLALLVEVLLDPRAGAALSVQLSYAATLGLVVGTSPLRRILAVPVPAATDALGNPRNALLRAVLARAEVAGTSALAASLAAVAATLPFVWWRLGEWAPLGALATIAIAPAAAVLLFAGWIAALAPGLVPDLALAVPARTILATLEVFDALPGSPDVLPHRPVLLVASAIGLGFAAIAGRTERLRDRAGRGAALLCASLCVPWTSAPRELEVHALDVGHGTCCIVRAPGLGTWVFDAGSRDRSEVARAALAPALRAFDPGRIGVVLSHPDRDHDGALPWLASRYEVAVHAGALPARLAERLPHTALRIDLATGRAALPTLQGSCVDGALWLERGLDVAGNQGSRTLRVVWRGASVLLAGDADAEGLRAWLDLPAHEGPVRLLLAPHHGSEIERIGRLLEALQPAEVWVSGQARPPIAGELERRGIAWRSTAGGPLVLHGAGQADRARAAVPAGAADGARATD